MADTVYREMNSYTAITKALSDPHRVRALMALRRGELCLCQLIDLFALAPSTVSKHLSILKQAGLVESRKDGKWVYYRLAGKTGKNRYVFKIITLSISLLEQDCVILDDDKSLSTILSRGAGTQCQKT